MFGGGEIWMLSTMEELARRGHTVHLVCRPRSPLEQRARATGLSVFTLDMKSDLDPMVVFRMWRLLRKLKIDVLCTNMDKELRFGGLAGRLAGVKAVIPRRGIDYALKNTWVFRWSYTKIASGIIANSMATKKALLRNSPWLPEDRIRVIYNGVDWIRFTSPPRKDCRREWGIPDRDFVVGFVGQLDPRKGVDTLMEAYARFSSEESGTTLVLAGEGRLNDVLHQKASECRGRVVFTGFQEHVDEIMKTVDVLVLPSLWEGFGFVLIEAMAAFKPVIATRASSLPEIVTDQENGFLISPGDAGALAEKLTVLKKQPDLRKRMGQTGQRIVRTRFDFHRMVDETEHFFSDLAAGFHP